MVSHLDMMRSLILSIMTVFLEFLLGRISWRSCFGLYQYLIWENAKTGWEEGVFFHSEVGFFVK